MRKSKQLVISAVQAYVDLLLAKFPELEPDISVEPFEGSDAWLRFGLPAEHDDEYFDEVQDETVRLSWDFREKTGVNIVASLTLKEALFHG